MPFSSHIKDKWIVVTRPVHQALSIQQKLEKAGANIILYPLLEIIAPTKPERAKQQLAQIDSYDLVIFVSANAVEKSLKWINLSKLLNQKTQVASIGKKTSIALKRQGIIPNITPQAPYNSEAFLHLAEIKHLETLPSTIKKVAIIRGEGGRTLLYDHFINQGLSVDHIDVYKRHCPQTNITPLKQQYQQGELDIIMLTSGSSATNLFKLAKHEDWINNVTLLMGSQRMQQHVPTCFSGNLLIADDPSDETLFKKLTET